jgi:hypothetical protein
MAAKNNKNNLKHGGAAAIQALTSGAEFTGLAAETQKEVEADLVMRGQSAMVLENATRVQAAARLYWNAISKAMDDGNLANLDHYIARFGWLVGVANRSWDQARKDMPDKKKLDVIDLLRGENDQPG